jgi:hypothetical protein
MSNEQLDRSIDFAALEKCERTILTDFAVSVVAGTRPGSVNKDHRAPYWIEFPQLDGRIGYVRVGWAEDGRRGEWVKVGEARTAAVRAEKEGK